MSRRSTCTTTGCRTTSRHRSEPPRATRPVEVRKLRASIEVLPSIRRTYVLQGSTRQQDGSYQAQTGARLHGRLSKAVHIGDQNWFWDSKQGPLWINAPKGRYPDDGTTIAVTVNVVEESWLPATATVRVTCANGKGYAANYTFELGAFEVKAP